MQNLLLLLSASVSSKNVESFFEDAAKVDVFKNSSRQLGFFLNDEGANRPRMLNELGCGHAVPRTRGLNVCGSKHIPPVRRDNRAPRPPAAPTPSTITAAIPHVLDLLKPNPSRRLMFPDRNGNQTTQPDILQPETQLPETQKPEAQKPKTQQPEVEQTTQPETQRSEAETEGEDTCCICLDPIDGDKYAPFICSLRTERYRVPHTFDEDCITDWCKRSTVPKCPECRANLIPGTRLDQEAKSRRDQEINSQLIEFFRSFPSGSFPPRPFVVMIRPEE